MRRGRRWVAAAGAVAAAFLVGIFTGHLTHQLPGRPCRDAHGRRAPVDAVAPLRTVVASLSDDELLGQIELAVGSAGPAALRRSTR